MKSIRIRIEGITPLICNRFTEEQADKATSGSNSALIGDRGSPREQASQKLYRDGDTLIIPQPNLLSCITAAGKFHKAGKSKVTTLKSSLIPGCVDFGSQVAVKIESKEGWEVDTRPVRIPSTGGRILCHRPMFHDWALEFYVELNTDIMGPKVLRAIVDDAGARIGLGDFRPDCKGPFGRFKVTRWEIEEDAEEGE